MEESYIVRLYVRRLFGWKPYDFYAFRASAYQAARALESVGIRIKLVQVSSTGEQDLIYESRFK